ncbi:MAG: hypothetical protein WKF60_07410 [Ilumatobacter sp.]
MPVDETPDTSRPGDGWATIQTPVIALVVMLISVIAPLERLLSSGWISDDTSWQVALRTWRPGGGEWVLTENTYILHWPLFVISNALLPSNRWTILILAVILQAVGLWLIVSFARHAIAEAVERLVSGLRWWHDLLAVGVCGAYQVADQIMRVSNAGVTTRNLEVGLYLLAIRLGFEVVVGDRQVGTIGRHSVVAGGVALLSLNDPLFAYTIVVPFIGLIVLAFVVRWAPRRTDSHGGGAESADVRWRAAYSLASSAGAGLLIWQAAHAALPFVGITQRPASTRLSDLGAVPGHARVVLGGLGQMAGRRLISDASILVQVIGVILFVVAMASVVAVLVRPLARRSGSRSSWLAIISLGWLAIVATTYMITTSGASLAEFRYVAVAFPSVGVAVAVSVSSLPRAANYGFVIVAVAAIGGAGTLAIARDADDGELLMPETSDILDDLAANGYDRGYSGYWTSSILTYLSDAPVLPVVCSDVGLTVPYEWLVDMGQFDDALDRPGDRSFIVVDRRAALSLTCPDELLIEQHGRPVDVLLVRNDIEVWLYDDRDVVADITRAWAR